ncbi:unnamed protein product [Ceratitis capitata]|uniref:(Mediterranean fruit fly) hypothetical protein n=1 Tax=Ceratitis capitata TaxID=7213 RepID=A0A811UTI4_CERCA|nr:unnamed protein product [Ceratitis capitata]
MTKLLLETVTVTVAKYQTLRDILREEFNKSAQIFKELIKRYELIESFDKSNASNKRRQTAELKSYEQNRVDKGDRENERKHCLNCGSTQHKRVDCKE